MADSSLIRLQKRPDLEIRIISHSKSSGLTRIDSPPMTFY